MKYEIPQFINFTFSQFINSSRPQTKCIKIEVWYTKWYTPHSDCFRNILTAMSTELEYNSLNPFFNFVAHCLINVTPFNTIKV